MDEESPRGLPGWLLLRTRWSLTLSLQTTRPHSWFSSLIRLASVIIIATCWMNVNCKLRWSACQVFRGVNMLIISASKRGWEMNIKSLDIQMHHISVYTDIHWTTILLVVSSHHRNKYINCKPGRTQSCPTCLPSVQDACKVHPGSSKDMRGGGPQKSGHQLLLSSSGSTHALLYLVSHLLEIPLPLWTSGRLAAHKDSRVVPGPESRSQTHCGCMDAACARNNKKSEHRHTTPRLRHHFLNWIPICNSTRISNLIFKICAYGNLTKMKGSMKANFIIQLRIMKSWITIFKCCKTSGVRIF